MNYTISRNVIKNSVIAVVQLINKEGTREDYGGRDHCAGMRFTHQDEAVIGAFLSLLGPHIFASSMLQPKRKMHIKVGHSVPSYLYETRHERLVVR